MKEDDRLIKSTLLRKNGHQKTKEKDSEGSSIQSSYINQDYFHKDYHSQEDSSKIRLPIQHQAIIQRKVKVGENEIISDLPAGVVSAAGGVQIKDWLVGKKYTDEQKEKLKHLADKKYTLYRFANEEQLKQYLTIKKGEAELKVNFINVGQGSSTLVSKRQKEVSKYGLVDTGANPVNVPEFMKFKSDSYFKGEVRAGKEGKTVEGKTKFGIDSDRIKTFITHNHADHIGASEEKTLTYSPIVSGEREYRRRTEPKGSALETEDTIFSKTPIKPIMTDKAHKASDDENDDSLVMYTTTENEVVILPGDRGVEDLIEILKKLKSEKYNFAGKKVIIAASHHGSITGNSAALLNLFSEAKELLIIISAGCENSYHLPSAKEYLEDPEKPGKPMPDGTKRETDDGTKYTLYNTQNFQNSKGSIVYKAKGDQSAIYSKQILDGEIDTSGSKIGLNVLARFNAFIDKHNYEYIKEELGKNSFSEDVVLFRHCYYVYNAIRGQGDTSKKSQKDFEALSQDNKTEFKKCFENYIGGVKDLTEIKFLDGEVEWIRSGRERAGKKNSTNNSTNNSISSLGSKVAEGRGGLKRTREEKPKRGIRIRDDE